MRLLLDTHIFIWALTEELGPLPRHARRSMRAIQSALENPDNVLHASAINALEWAIKSEKTRREGLTAEAGGTILIPDLEARCRQMDVQVEPFSMRAACRVESLPLFHRDPFDRALIAQAVDLGAALCTVDGRLHAYVPAVPGFAVFPLPRRSQEE